MSDVIDPRLLLLARMLNEQGGHRRGERVRQLGFLREFVDFEFKLANEKNLPGLKWERISDGPANQVRIRLLGLPDWALSERFEIREAGSGAGFSPPIGFYEGENDSIAIVERTPASGKIDLEVNKTILFRKSRAIQRWSDFPHSERVGFDRLFEPEGDVFWPKPEPTSVERWHFLTDDSRTSVASQRLFVSRALATPDFAFLDGPPGSGKTTVICELVVQLVERGKRVLLCGQTHESVDNVLERLVGEMGGGLVDIMPLRIASKQTIKKASSAASRFIRENISETVGSSIRDRLDRQENRSHSQDLILGALSGDKNALGTFLVESANVLCGTTSGVVADSLLSSYFLSGEPVFDYLIVDEASKLTLAEFLIPALLAKRWVLSGDPLQLPPYEDSDELVEWLAQVAGTRAEQSSDDVRGQFEALAHSVSNKFALRFAEPFSDFDIEELVDKHLRNVNPESMEKVREKLPDLVRLGMTSPLEQLITRKAPSYRAKRSQRPAAVDVGLPDFVLDSRLVRLEYQQRMHSDISKLVREPVYKGRAMKDVAGFDEERAWTYGRYKSRAVFIDARPTQKEQRGLRGQDVTQQEVEAQVGLAELRSFVRWVDNAGPSGREWTVGLLSFYRGGVSALRRLIEQEFEEEFESGEMDLGRERLVRVRLSTVNSFQGREVDMTLLHIGNRRVTAFTKSLNNVNVALTRARYQLVIIGNRTTLRDSRNSLIGQMASDENLFGGYGHLDGRLDRV